VRSTIGTASPQVGTITPTGDSAPLGSGHGSGTYLRHELKTVSHPLVRVNRFATAKLHANQGRSWLSEDSSQGM
jgi:hypothetical protein